MKKNLLYLCSMVLLLASVLSACGESTLGDKDQHVTLRYALWHEAQAPAMEKIAKAFTAVHPNIEIKVELTPWKDYFTKLETATTGGSGPDVFWLNAANLAKYASNDVLLQLDEHIQQDNVDLNNYPSSLVSLYTYDGKQYGLPKDFDTIGLWYNKTLFDAADVKYPDDTWTWSTVQEVAKKLTDKEKGVWGIAAQMNGHQGFYNTIAQNGGTVISADKKSVGFDTPEAIGGIKFWVDMIKNEVSPTAAQLTDTPAISMFESGKIAMFYSGSWNNLEFSKNEYTKDKVDVAVLPQGKKRAAIIHGLGNVISASTKYPEAAWEFVKFLGGKEAAEIQAQSGTVIPAYKGYQEAWIKSTPQFHLQHFIDELPYVVAFPASKNTDAWTEIQDKVFNKVWDGNLSIEEGTRQATQQINQLLAQE